MVAEIITTKRTIKVLGAVGAASSCDTATAWASARSNNSMGFRQDPRMQTQGASLCWYLVDGWGNRNISHGIWVPLGAVFKSVYFSFLIFSSFICRSHTLLSFTPG